MINRHLSIHKVTGIFIYVQRFISSIKRRIQSSKVKQRTKKVKKACSSTPNERTVSNESYNSVSLEGKDFFEEQLQLYNFIQRNFFMNTRSSGISALKMQATAAEMQHNETFSKLTNPLDQKGLVV